MQEVAGSSPAATTIESTTCTSSKLSQTPNCPVFVRVSHPTAFNFYDNKRLVNSDPDDVKPKQPKRFSLWEIHPVIAFHVCVTADNDCDPKDLVQWQPLENVEEN
jgi:hypothetical protein